MSAVLTPRRSGAGLPGPLPEGETILWQGHPLRASIARRALHWRVVVVYFGALAALSLATSWEGGRRAGGIAVSIGLYVVATLAVLGLIWLFAALVARTTVYTITTRRIVMRIGVALPMSVNIPFAIIASAGVRTYPDGSGDIPIVLAGRGRLGYLYLWPHARPWRLGRPEPMLRGVGEAAQVAAILARALGGGPLGQAAAARQEATTALPAMQPPVAA